MNVEKPLDEDAMVMVASVIMASTRMLSKIDDDAAEFITYLDGI